MSATLRISMSMGISIAKHFGNQHGPVIARATCKVAGSRIRTQMGCQVAWDRNPRNGAFSQLADRTRQELRFGKWNAGRVELGNAVSQESISQRGDWHGPASMRVQPADVPSS